MKRNRTNSVLTAPPHLQEALRDGLIERRPGRLVVPAAVSPTKQELAAAYDQYTIVDGLSPEQFGKAAAALTGGDIQRATKLFNTQYDITVRTPIRHRLVAAARKPKRSLEKAAKTLVDAGLVRTMDEALKRLEEMRQQSAS